MVVEVLLKISQDDFILFQLRGPELHPLIFAGARGSGKGIPLTLDPRPVWPRPQEAG